MSEALKVGLVSDTHGWLDPVLVEVFAGCAAIVHGGDVGSEGVLEALGAVAPTVAARGNIDGGPLRFLPWVARWEGNGRRVAALHIAGSVKRPNKEARALIAAEAPDVLVVGHSHIPAVGRVGRTLWINPGAAGRHGFHEVRTAAILYVEPDGELRLERVELGPRAELRRAGAAAALPRWDEDGEEEAG